MERRRMPGNHFSRKLIPAALFGSVLLIAATFAFVWMPDNRLLGIGLIAYRPFQMNRLAACAKHPADSFRGQIHILSDFLSRWLATELLLELLGDLV